MRTQFAAAMPAAPSGSSAEEYEVNSLSESRALESSALLWREFIANYLSVFAHTMYSPTLLHTDVSGHEALLNGHSSGVNGTAAPESLNERQGPVEEAPALSEFEMSSLLYDDVVRSGTATLSDFNNVRTPLTSHRLCLPFN